MAGDLQRDGVKFCRSIFDTVRKMSADGLGVTRQGYSSTESEVLDYLKMIGQELGLEINTDLAGNVWMCLPGKNRELPAFVAGSHADSVPQGGNYDGLAGIAAALAVAWWMRRTGFVPERDYMILMMRCEESSFFGKAYVGSLALTGKLTLADTAFRPAVLFLPILRPVVLLWTSKRLQPSSNYTSNRARRLTARKPNASAL